MKNLILLSLSLFLINCSDNSNTQDCTDCGGGLLDGYLFKEVTTGDLESLGQISVNADLGACIRYKLDGEDFEDAVVVDDCCCLDI